MYVLEHGSSVVSAGGYFRAFCLISLKKKSVLKNKYTCLFEYAHSCAPQPYTVWAPSSFLWNFEIVSIYTNPAQSHNVSPSSGCYCTSLISYMHTHINWLAADRH